MKQPVIETRRIRRINLHVDLLLKEMREKYKGRIVTLDHVTYPAKAKGRKAVIHGVIYDSPEGLLFLCMVLSEKDGSMLNSDTWTRQYRPASDFELSKEIMVQVVLNGQTLFWTQQQWLAHLAKHPGGGGGVSR